MIDRAENVMTHNKQSVVHTDIWKIYRPVAPAQATCRSLSQSKHGNKGQF